MGDDGLGLRFAVCPSSSDSAPGLVEHGGLQTRLREDPQGWLELHEECHLLCLRDLQYTQGRMLIFSMLHFL